MKLNISENTTIKELGKIPELAIVRDLLFTNPDEEKLDSRLSDYGVRMGGLLEALDFTAQAAARKDFIIPLYEPGTGNGSSFPSQMKDRTNSCSAAGPADVCLLNFSSHPGGPVCIICPGGGYNREWVLVEGYPMAQALSAQGINAFILIYRTGYYGLFPHPLDDLARAVAWLLRNQERLSVNMENYAVMGASAGGHLCAMWGTAQAGARSYHLPSPAALLLMYPAGILTCFYELWESRIKEGKYEEAEDCAAYLKRIGGEAFTRKDIERYSLDCLMDDDYPPVYLVHAEDDPVVPVRSSHMTEELLHKHNIPCQVLFAEKGGHSFGLGIGTGAEGWIDEAIAFYKRRL